MNTERVKKSIFTVDIQERNDESGHYFYGCIPKFRDSHGIIETTGKTEEIVYENLMKMLETYVEFKDGMPHTNCPIVDIRRK